jgi:hypothetical protein
VTRPSAPLGPYEDEQETQDVNRLATTAPWLAVAALVVAVAGLGVAVFGRGGDADTCRHQAWAAMPAAGDLPSGWTLSSTDLNANGMTVSINGPAATDGTSNPVVYASVTCYGSVAATAIADYRNAATSAGATVTDRGLGGNAYDVDNPSTGSVTTLFRVGGLIGQIADAGSATPDELASITSAVAAAMGDKSAAGTSAGGPGASGATGSDQPIPQPSGSDAAGASPSSAAPELEALIPTQIGATTLTVQSATAADVLATDPNSRALGAVVRSLGAKSTDLQFAQAYDETSTIDLSIVGFRLANGDGAKLKTAIIDTWLSAGATGVKKTDVTLSGKTVTKIDYGDAGTIEYVYGGPDYVIVIDTADATLATEVASKLK